MIFNKSSLALAISASLFSLTSFSSIAAQENKNISADETIETITVNSDFRQQNLQKVPSSLSVLTNVDIEQRNAKHLEELIAVSPNVNFASGSQRARYYQIRGIGERSQFQEPINPSVGMIIDEVDFTGIGSIANLFDTSQVEIFRGPQGTRFGANAIAGMINITTKAPTDTFEGALQFDVGNYNSYGLGIALSGPATDAINYRLAINKYSSVGFIENNHLGLKDTNNRDELNVRAKLAIEASSDLTIDLTAFHFDFDNGYDAFSLDNNRTTLSDQPGFDTQKTSALAAKFTYQGLDTVTLVAIVSASDSDLAYGYDEDWAYGEYEWRSDKPIEQPDPCITPTGCLADFDGYSSTDHYLRDKSVQTVELRALSKAGEEIFNGSTAWLAGIYFKQDNEDLTRQYTYADTDFDSSNESDAIAVFGQLDSQLSEKLTLTTGLRVEKRSADYTNSDLFTDVANDTMFGGKLVLSYQTTADSLWYGSINRGYKAGGSNTDGSLADQFRSFDPEYLMNYEVGYKVAFFENDAYLRSAFFYMDRTDMQVKSSQTIVREDGSVEFIPFLGNAATGSNLGIEIESAWQINNLINIYGSLGLLDTEFNDFTDPEGNSLSGEAQSHAPNYQFNLGINIQPSEHWLLNISVDGKDEFYFSDSRYYYGEAISEDDLTSEAVALVNASVSYLADSWQVKVWARNLTDKEYANRGFYFGNDPRDGYAAKQYTQLSEPLVFGATLDYQF